MKTTLPLVQTRWQAAPPFSIPPPPQWPCGTPAITCRHLVAGDTKAEMFQREMPRISGGTSIAPPELQVTYRYINIKDITYRHVPPNHVGILEYGFGNALLPTPPRLGSVSARRLRLSERLCSSLRAVPSREILHPITPSTIICIPFLINRSIPCSRVGMPSPVSLSTVPASTLSRACLPSVPSVR